VTLFGPDVACCKSKSLAWDTFSTALPAKTVGREKETVPMSLFANVSFFEVSMALLFVGMAERMLLAYAPAEMVGAKGWLIRGDIEE
jgi:hypothetical protein